MAGLVMGYINAASAIVFSIWFIFFGGIAAMTGNPSPTSSP